MGNEISINKIGYEDVQYAINNNFIIINTLSSIKQSCLIKNTINTNDEETTINQLINDVNSNITIIIYGENSLDKSPIEKCKKLIQYGFSNIHIYVGGLFEWMLLQDIYGCDNFPTTSNELDILKFRAISTLNKKYLK